MDKKKFRRKTILMIISFLSRQMLLIVITNLFLMYYYFTYDLSMYLCLLIPIALASYYIKSNIFLDFNLYKLILYYRYIVFMIFPGFIVSGFILIIIIANFCPDTYLGPNDSNSSREVAEIKREFESSVFWLSTLIISLINCYLLENRFTNLIYDKLLKSKTYLEVISKEKISPSKLKSVLSNQENYLEVWSYSQDSSDEEIYNYINKENLWS